MAWSEVDDRLMDDAHLRKTTWTARRRLNHPGLSAKNEARIRWLKSLEAHDHRRYFKSGFKAHEQSFGAFLRGSFNLFAARPGVGKTAFLFALAYRQVLAGVKAYFCNLEMSVEQMWNRLACLHDEALTLRELTEGQITGTRVQYFMATVCRFHGARGGGPNGKRNGMYRHGLFTKEAKAERRMHQTGMDTGRNSLPQKS